MERTIEDIGAKMDALGVWEAVAPYNWAVCPKGTVFPYFCCVMKGDGNPVNVRFMMIEGWQSFHDFVRTRIDVNFGFYSTPMEIPHFELVFVSGGEVRLFRHDPCFMPRLATDAERAFCSKILWESYGVMMRVEADSELPLKFASEKAMFARVEGDGGSWSDKALSIPDPRPHVESVTFAKADLAKAKDLPFAAEEKVVVEFALAIGISTKEPRPRCVYRLSARDAATGEQFVADAVSPVPDGGLRAMWEGVAPRLLKHFLARGRIPGEIMVGSQRLFRMLRPLCLDIPLKLSLHDKLPGAPANA
ncbi:MAG: hypothetical protein IKU71_06560 [Kiritimatiellae bacterium]|nr:hypothetical protein [Kiritimatiellia bacterium]